MSSNYEVMALFEFEVKVKVTSVKIFTWTERSCPKVYVCQILKL